MIGQSLYLFYKLYLSFVALLCLALILESNHQTVLFLSNIRTFLILPAFALGLALVYRSPFSKWTILTVLTVAALPWHLRSHPSYCLEPGQNASRMLRAMTLNLAGSSSNDRNLARIAREQELDILALQEVTPGFWKTEGATLRKYFAHFAYRESSEGYWTQALLSRYPLDSIEFRDPGPGFSNFDSRLVIKATVTINEESFQILVVHLSVPFYRGPCRGMMCLLTRYDQTQRDDQLRLLLQWFTSGEATSLILGDLNISDQNPVYLEILENALDSGRCSHGDPATWPANYSLPAFTRIDYALIHPGLIAPFRLHSRTLQLPQTDHRGVIADFYLVAP